MLGKNNSRLATREEIQESLTKINKNTKIEKSGIPILYDEENLYIDDKEHHCLIIGATGSGKTQTTLLPVTKLAIMAGENIFVNDPNGEIYERLNPLLVEKNYNTQIIDLKNYNKNKWNPLELVNKLYKEGQKDRALDILDNIAYYLLDNKQHVNDMFWITTATNYFKGLVLYLIETNNKVTLSEVNELSKTMKEEVLENVSNTVRSYLEPTVLAPTETKGGILSVFRNMIGLYLRPQLLEVLNDNDIDFNHNQKQAYFFIGDNKKTNDRLISLFIEELTYTKCISENKNRLNIFADDFENLYPINDFSRKLSYQRGHGIKYFVYTSNINILNNRIESEEAIQSFGNIIFLSSNDKYTLDFVNNNCGEIGFDSLISCAELKTLKIFEAVVMINRLYPIKTKLIPDFEIKWD